MVLICYRSCMKHGWRIQGSNYDTDIWDPIFEAIRVATGAEPYSGQACLVRLQPVLSQ